jgi:hypothetical protein
MAFFPYRQGGINSKLYNKLLTDLYGQNFTSALSRAGAQGSLLFKKEIKTNFLNDYETKITFNFMYKLDSACTGLCAKPNYHRYGYGQG